MSSRGTSKLTREPLLLLPGTACDERLFAPLLASLDGWPTKIGDMQAGRSAAEQARLVLADAPERFALLGFSLGGIVALEMIAQAPGRITRLALVDSTARPDPEANAAVRYAALERARRDGMEGYILESWEKLVAPANRGRTGLRKMIVAMALDSGADVLERQTQIAINRADSRPRLGAIAVPTIVVAGEEEQVCPIAAQTEMAEAIPDARLILIPQAGHFTPLENPQSLAPHILGWLGAGTDKPLSREPEGANMSEADTPKTAGGAPARKPVVEEVLQVERRDYTDLAPANRPRSQSLEGFDEIYTDIVDYIVRCTHRIWDERDIGLIYTHYTHNCVLYGTMGAMYDREAVVRDTIQRLVSLPERRGMATQVIWDGNDVDGFYTSHLVTGSGRHTQYGHFGPPTGRTFVSRTIADCMIYRNKIYREWVVADTMAILKQLGIDPHGYAEKLAQLQYDKGFTNLDIGENRRLLGQYPPESEADLSIAKNDIERDTLNWLHEVFNKRMFGKINDVYAPTVQYHGPLMKELYGVAAVIHQHLGLIGSLPDAAYMPQYICSVPCEEGGVKVAVRWLMEGHHLGYGILNELGDPTGERVQVMGMSHYHYKNGRIVDEWTVYDELSMLMQVKLAQIGGRRPEGEEL